jgi:hypothetical protein
MAIHYTECSYGFFFWEDGRIDAGDNKFFFSSLSQKEKEEFIEDCLFFFYGDDETEYTETEKKRIEESLLEILI